MMHLPARVGVYLVTAPRAMRRGGDTTLSRPRVANIHKNPRSSIPLLKKPVVVWQEDAARVFRVPPVRSRSRWLRQSLPDALLYLHGVRQKVTMAAISATISPETVHLRLRPRPASRFVLYLRLQEELYFRREFSEMSRLRPEKSLIKLISDMRPSTAGGF
jgi:hypothetical protein